MSQNLNLKTYVADDIIGLFGLIKELAMISSISSSLQAIQNGQRKIAEIANNIANISTPGFRTPGSDPIIGESPDEQAVSNVDLSEEFIKLTQTKQGIEANVKVVKVTKDLEQSVLDILA